MSWARFVREYFPARESDVGRKSWILKESQGPSRVAVVSIPGRIFIPAGKKL